MPPNNVVALLLEFLELESGCLWPGLDTSLAVDGIVDEVEMGIEESPANGFLTGVFTSTGGRPIVGCSILRVSFSRGVCVLVGDPSEMCLKVTRSCPVILHRDLNCMKPH